METYRHESRLTRNFDVMLTLDLEVREEAHLLVDTVSNGQELIQRYGSCIMKIEVE